MRSISILIILCFAIGCADKKAAPHSVAIGVDSTKLPYYNSADFSPQWIDGNTKMPDTFHTIPAFSFTDQDGKSITERSVADKIVVANFFFTSCRGICPRLTTDLQMVQTAFEQDDKVIILSHSVMPKTDNVKALKRYADNYKINSQKWHLLTGDKDAIYTIARKGYFADEDMGATKTTTDFLHTENVLLIDTKRHIRGIYKGTSPLEMQNLIADIKTLEKE